MPGAAKAVGITHSQFAGVCLAAGSAQRDIVVIGLRGGKDEVFSKEKVGIRDVQVGNYLVTPQKVGVVVFCLQYQLS